MAGRGPAPKVARHRRGAPARGEWIPSPDGGWQHALPPPPAGLLASSTAAWDTWFRSWWAGHWTPDDLPALRLLIRLYDRVGRGDVRRLGELRQMMDSYGITPKGQQDRRWQRPAPPKPPTTLDRYLREGAFPSAKERFTAPEGERSGGADPRLRLGRSR